MFIVLNDVTVFCLKDQLDQIRGHLNHRDTRRIHSVEYRRSSMDSNESAQFTLMKLWNNDEVRIMFSVFGQHSLKGPVELDVSLVISFQDICENLI